MALPPGLHHRGDEDVRVGGALGMEGLVSSVRRRFIKLHKD